MEKFKRVLFMSVFVISLVTSSCSCEKHKNYIPADSKVLGKIDFKEFFKQSGADKDKLMQDLEDYLGDEASIEDMGLDLSVPMYIFGHGKGVDLSFGVVAKVDDREKVKDWFDDKEIEIETEEKKDDFEYAVNGTSAIGVNDDALVILFVASGGESEAKREIKKVMRKDFDGDIDDNKLMEKMKENKSFACLYADMSILPSEALDVLTSQKPELKESLNDLAEMTIGIDARFQEGICDFESWAESDKKDVQAKIDKMKSAYRKVDSKGIQTIPADALLGFVANIDGPKISDILKSVIDDNTFGQLGDIGNYVGEFLNIVKDIDGNLAGYLEMDENPYPEMMFAVESKNSTSGDIVRILREIEESNSSYNNSYNNYDSYDSNPNDSYDSDYTGDSIPRNDYDSRYNSPSRIHETSDGYRINNTWFGNKNGALYITNNESLISSAFEKADKQVSSSLSSLMQERKATFFVNIKKAKEKAKDMQDKDAKKIMNAFAEIIDKVDYITFSMK